MDIQVGKLKIWDGNSTEIHLRFLGNYWKTERGIDRLRLEIKFTTSEDMEISKFFTKLNKIINLTFFRFFERWTINGENFEKEKMEKSLENYEYYPELFLISHDYCE